MGRHSATGRWAAFRPSGPWQPGFLACVLLLAACLPALAQGPSPVWPPDNFVFQRASDGFGRPAFVARVAPGESVNARLCTDSGQFLEQARATADANGVAFVRFSRQAPGFYRVVLAGASGRTTLRAAVGELFLVAGQSNAVSTNYGHAPAASETGLVVVNDYYGDLGPTRGGEIRSLERLLVPSANDGITSNVCWVVCGDILARRFGVPVGFLNVAVSNTDSNRWNPATGDLAARLLELQRMASFRAVLWQQGESDVINKVPGERSLENLTALLQASRAVTPEMPWFVARNSHKDGTPYRDQPVRRAQESLIRQGLALAGPDTDQIRDVKDWSGFADFCHQGLDRNGELWAEALLPWLAGRVRR